MGEAVDHDKSNIKAWRATNRQPPMKENPDFYELRVLDDDDGTPDTDMQPLDRSTLISIL